MTDPQPAYLAVLTAAQEATPPEVDINQRIAFLSALATMSDALGEAVAVGQDITKEQWATITDNLGVILFDDTPANVRTRQFDVLSQQLEIWCGELRAERDGTGN